MKSFIRPVRTFAAVFFVGCVLGFVSCDDNEGEHLPNPDEVTTDVMFGQYAGKMSVQSAGLAGEDGTDGGEEEPAGTDVSATVDRDTVFFEQFPIRDVVLAVVKDEALADRIVEAVGNVSYQIGYEPTLTANKDSVYFVLHPEALKLAVSLPAAAEGEEAQPLQIEVKVEAAGQADYAVETGRARFGLTATEVLLGEGEDQTPLDGFSPIGLSFDMNQQQVTPHRL